MANERRPSNDEREAAAAEVRAANLAARDARNAPREALTRDELVEREWTVASARIAALGIEQPEQFRPMFDALAATIPEDVTGSALHRAVRDRMRDGAATLRTARTAIETHEQPSAPERFVADIHALGIEARVVADIRRERQRQQRSVEDGGEAFNLAHDDSHSVDDWRAFIDSYLDRAAEAALLDTEQGRSDYRHRMVQVAALAVAAIESFDRATAEG